MRSSTLTQVLILLGFLLGCLYLVFLSPIAFLFALLNPEAVYSSLQFLSQEGFFNPSPMALYVATVLISLLALVLTLLPSRIRFRRQMQAFLLAIIFAPAALLGAEYLLPLPASTVLLLSLTFPGDPTFLIHIALALASLVLVSIPIYLLLNLAATFRSRQRTPGPPRT